MRATTQDGSHPRPTLLREAWLDLDGTWGFAHDDADVGLAERWWAVDAPTWERTIEVPFPPESPASGVEERGFHAVVWYRREIPHGDLVAAAGASDRVLLHLGAVDHHATVWCDGHRVADHSGGQTGFTADLTDVVDLGRDVHVLVVRAQDDPRDPDQARGKQDWLEQPHGIWYERTTGIWQSVWAEVVPAAHVTGVVLDPDLPRGVLAGEVTLSRVAGVGEVEVEVRLVGKTGEELLGAQRVHVTGASARVGVDVPVEALRNGQDRARLLWTPEHPVLLDVAVRLYDASGAPGDEVASYAGVRTVGVDRGGFRLNDQPVEVRAVLDQGYRPQTHLASRGSAELRAEVETVKALGFNCARLHQKVEDPRLLFWADRLGLMVWGEAAAAYAFSGDAVAAYAREWTDAVRRDRGHPCIVTWVPVNESWGVQDLATSPAQRSYVAGLAALTRALDPTRPVLSNEGWEHVDSDLLGLHDYTGDPEELRARYATREALDDVVLDGRTPHGRRPVLGEAQAARYRDRSTPVMVTEFGGVDLVAADRRGDTDSWGYSSAGSEKEYAALLRDQFDALRASPLLSGWCYTQLMDTGQETNGLLYADGTPKLPVEVVRAIVTGDREPAATSTAGWLD